MVNGRVDLLVVNPKKVTRAVRRFSEASEYGRGAAAARTALPRRRVVHLGLRM